MSQIVSSSLEIEILAHTTEQKVEILLEELNTIIEDKKILNAVLQKVDGFNYELKLALNDCKELIGKCDARNFAYKTAAENIIKLQAMSQKLGEGYAG